MYTLEDKKCSSISIIIPCFNEEKTLKNCVDRVLEIADDDLSIEIIIVDDCSSDRSLPIALDLEKKHPEIAVIHHEKNQGKGAALRTGFQKAGGDFVAVQDADLEYDPMDLKKLLVPLIEDKADAVLGSRFLSAGAHRVLYFWHSLGNRFLTLLSNMFTDLNLTDMETCYKVFRREIIQSIEIEENRFGFEPEIVAKMAQLRLRIFEMGISYYGRTYEEGKKIGLIDAIRALYCIFHYNAHKTPLPIQVTIYSFVGGVSYIANLLSFILMMSLDFSVGFSAVSSFSVAALLNYFLCVMFLFKHEVKWKASYEILIFVSIVCLIGALDLGLTKYFLSMSVSNAASKSFASIICFVFNFVGRRFLVFPESASGPWTPQETAKDR